MATLFFKLLFLSATVPVSTLTVSYCFCRLLFLLTALPCGHFSCWLLFLLATFPVGYSFCLLLFLDLLSLLATLPVVYSSCLANLPILPLFLFGHSSDLAILPVGYSLCVSFFSCRLLFLYAALLFAYYSYLSTLTVGCSAVKDNSSFSVCLGQR